MGDNIDILKLVNVGDMQTAANASNFSADRAVKFTKNGVTVWIPVMADTGNQTVPW